MLTQTKIVKPIRIVHLIGSLGSGGAEKMLAAIAMNMDKNKIEHIIISFTAGGFWEYELREAGISVITLNLTSHLSWAWKLFFLAKILSQLKPDILQTWMEYANFIGIIVGKALGIKIVLWSIRCSYLDMSYYSLTAKIIFKLTAYLAKFSNAILVNSYAGQKEHQKIGYNAKAWVYLPNGFDVGKFSISINQKKRLRQKLGINESDFVIGTVGRYDPIKNYPGLLLAMSKFLKLYPTVKFLLVGQGMDHNNIELINSLKQVNILDSTILLGEQRNIEKIMHVLDVFSLFSHGEGFSNVIGEAMLSNVICVATDVGDNKIIMNNTGFIIPRNDLDSLVNTWTIIFKMSVYERIALGNDARLRILNNYNLVDAVNKYNDFYQELFYQHKLLYLMDIN